MKREKLQAYKLLAIFLSFILFSGCSKATPYAKDALLMDTFVRVEISDNLPIDQKRQAFDNAIARMKELEKRFDYFSEDSELSKLNSGEGISLSPEMSKVLKKSEDLRKMTGGAFDIRFDPGKKINLGGIAKGFIVDEGIHALKASGINNALINAGGDMYCMGEGSGEGFVRRSLSAMNFCSGEGGWIVGVRDPENRQKIIATFKVRDKGVATSGGYERPSHIIDPRTGQPVKVVARSVTVVANDCMTGDALATALYVLGPKNGLSFIEGIDDAECVIIDEYGEVHISSGFRQTVRDFQFPRR